MDRRRYFARIEQISWDPGTCTVPCSKDHASCHQLARRVPCSLDHNSVGANLDGLDGLLVGVEGGKDISVLLLGKRELLLRASEVKGIDL